MVDTILGAIFGVLISFFIYWMINLRRSLQSEVYYLREQNKDLLEQKRFILHATEHMEDDSLQLKRANFDLQAENRDLQAEIDDKGY